MADLYRGAKTFCVCHLSHLKVHFSQKSTIYHLNVSQDCPKYDGLVSKNRRIKCIHSSPCKNQINTEEYTMTFVCVSVCSMVFFFIPLLFLGRDWCGKMQPQCGGEGAHLCDMRSARARCPLPNYPRCWSSSSRFLRGIFFTRERSLLSTEL